MRSVIGGGHLADHGGEPAAGRVPTHRDAMGIKTQRDRVLRPPLGCRKAVLERGRKPMLWCLPVADRDYGAAALLGQHAAEPVVGLDIAEDAAAAMEEHQRRQGQRGGLLRAVEAVGQGAPRPPQPPLLHLVDPHPPDVHPFPPSPETPPHPFPPPPPHFPPSPPPPHPYR